MRFKLVFFPLLFFSPFPATKQKQHTKSASRTQSSNQLKKQKNKTKQKSQISIKTKKKKKNVKHTKFKVMDSILKINERKEQRKKNVPVKLIAFIEKEGSCISNLRLIIVEGEVNL